MKNIQLHCIYYIIRLFYVRNKTVDSIFETVKQFVNDKVLGEVKKSINDMKEIQSSIKDPINDLLDNKIFDTVKKILFDVVDDNGIVSCSTLNEMLRSIGDFACCDLANDVIALSAASYINIY